MFFLKGHRNTNKKLGIMVFSALILAITVMAALTSVSHAKTLTLDERVKASLLYANLLNRKDSDGWGCLEDMGGWWHKETTSKDTNWSPTNDTGNDKNFGFTFTGTKPDEGISKLPGIDPFTRKYTDLTCAGLLKGLIDTVEDGQYKYASFYKRMSGKFFSDGRYAAWVFGGWALKGDCTNIWGKQDSTVNNVGDEYYIVKPNANTRGTNKAEGPTQCARKKGSGSLYKQFRDATKEAAGSRAIDSVSAEQWHMYYQTFVSPQGCAAEDGGSEMPQKNPDDGGNYYAKVPIAITGGEEFKILKTPKPQETIWLASTSSDGGLAEVTCEKIAAWLQNNKPAFDKYNQYLKEHPDEAKALGIAETADKSLQGTTEATESEDEATEEDPDCSDHLTGIGWIVCRVIDVAADFADSIWNLLEGFLQVNPLQTDGDSDAVYKAWGNIRDVANVLLAIIFITVIISQISNVGISNYGIKRVLPRLIIAAVAINLSYFILQLAVDISNVLGSTILDLITSSAPEPSPDAMSWGALIGEIVLASTITAGGIAAGTGALLTIGPGAMLTFLLMVLVPAILGVAGGFLALLVRSAFLPILAILAPITFVAWILPNTQFVFEKWRKIFSGLLFLYPLVSIYYGALKFAALTLLAQAADDGSIFNRFIGLSMLFMGSFVIIGIALKSNAIMGTMMGKMSKAFDKATKPMSKKLSAGADLMKKNRRATFLAGTYGERNPARLLQGGMKRFDKKKRDLKTQSALFDKNSQQRYNESLAALSPKDLEKRLGAAANTPAGRAYAEDLAEEAAKVRLRHEFKGDATKALKQSDDKILQAIAAEDLAGKGAWGASELRNYMEQGGRITSVRMGDAMAGAKNYDVGVANAGILAANALRKESASGMFKDGISINHEVLQTQTNEGVSKLSLEKLSSQNAAVLKSGVDSNSISDEKAYDLMNSGRLKNNLTTEAKEVLSGAAERHQKVLDANKPTRGNSNSESESGSGSGSGSNSGSTPTSQTPSARS